MPSYIKNVNLEEDYRRQKEQGTPLIDLCDLKEPTVLEEEELRKKFESMVSTFTGETFSLIASCECGAIKGNYNLNISNPVICHKCDTPVTAPFKEDIKSLVWFRVPEGCALLINPFVLAKLREFFKKSSFNFIDYFIDSNYKVSGANMAIAYSLSKICDQLKIKRGRKQFIENFFPILEKLLPLVDKTKSQRGVQLIEYLKNNQDNIFVDKIPIVNKVLLAVEKYSSDVMYVDNDVRNVMNAINILGRLNLSSGFKNAVSVDNRISKALISLCDYYVNHVKNIISPKKGKFRQGVYGFKYPYSFRAVVVPLTRPHSTIELELPWIIGLICMRDMVINKLYRMGYTYRKTMDMLANAVYEYCPIIDGIFKELINEAPHYNRLYPEIEELSEPIRGMPVNLLRWPTLEMGSIHFYTVVRISNDVRDYTIKMPPGNCKQQNGDFDGDALGGYFHVSKYMAVMARCFLPHNNICSTITPDLITNNLFIPKPMMNILSTEIENDYDYLEEIAM